MLVLWSLHCGLKRTPASRLAEVGLATVERHVAAFRDGGLAGLRRSGGQGSASDRTAYRDAIRESFAQQSVSTIAEACVRTEQLTGLRRGLMQVRKSL